MFWKEKKKKLERNIRRNNQFSTEMKDSRTPVFFISEGKKEEEEKKQHRHTEKK